jgi:hypothetical protein
MSVAAAIIGGVAALAGGGISALGAKKSAEAAEEQSALDRKLTEDSLKLQREKMDRDFGFQGMQYLADQRDRARGYSRTRSFLNMMHKSVNRPDNLQNAGQPTPVTQQSTAQPTRPVQGMNMQLPNNTQRQSASLGNVVKGAY